MGLSNLEKETVILFNEKEETASVYTHNGRLLRYLQRMQSERPEEALLVSEDEVFGSKTYQVPKKWVKIMASRVLSEEAKATLAERVRKISARDLVEENN